MSDLASMFFEPALALAKRQRRFLQATWLRRVPAPRFRKPNRVLLERPAFRLREFCMPGGSESTPVLVVPPEVNASTIVDFAPDQSLVETILGAGFERVAVLEWRSATAETAGRGVDSSIASIHESIAALGGAVHLIGICQGGWESAVATALEPDLVRSLTLVAAPIDFHAGTSVLQALARGMPFGFFQAMVAAGGGVMKGEFISQGFDNLVPFERHWLIPLSVWNHLDDVQWMERYHQLSDWYRARKDLPGPMYLTAVRELFQENRLIQGRFRVQGRRVDLGRICCPLVLVAGSDDHITPPPQVWAAEGAVSSQQVLRVEIPAGHVGTFMGRSALADHWPVLLAWLKQSQALPN